MLPSTFPFTTTLSDWTLPWIFPLLPTINVPPCDEISPCKVPSNVSSFENRIVPLISTPFKMLFFSPESVITFSSDRLTEHGVSARFMRALLPGSLTALVSDPHTVPHLRDWRSLCKLAARTDL